MGAFFRLGRTLRGLLRSNTGEEWPEILIPLKRLKTPLRASPALLAILAYTDLFRRILGPF
jgi:hypothetical protein